MRTRLRVIAVVVAAIVVEVVGVLIIVAVPVDLRLVERAGARAVITVATGRTDIVDPGVTREVARRL
ncbi:hypothetical protein chiPu_0031848, partial [Chiloscyllium punctatum]|nr:hypothetical protein [Chiloscyllium punctatum]